MLQIMQIQVTIIGRLRYIIEFQSHSVIGTESAFTIIIVHTSGRVDIFMV